MIRYHSDRLRKWAGKRACKSCATVYKEHGPVCAQCKRNPIVSDRWQPNLPTAKDIVMFYVQQRMPISAPEVADNVKLPARVIAEAMVALMDEGKLTTETGVVTVSKPPPKKKGTP